MPRRKVIRRKAKIRRDVRWPGAEPRMPRREMHTMPVHVVHAPRPCASRPTPNMPVRGACVCHAPYPCACLCTLAWRAQASTQDQCNGYPRRAVAASRCGTLTTLPSGRVTFTSCAGVAFHCDLRMRVRERDLRYFGVAISLASLSIADSFC